MELTCIADGLIEKKDGQLVKYELFRGIDDVKIQECDLKWRIFTMKLMRKIKDAPAEERERLLDSLQLEDAHWDWFKKAINLKGSGYDWFTLWVDGSIQGICITYQPKKSIINNGNIFYIEYLAVAPWNRDSLLNEREFKKVASIMMARIMEYFHDNKGLITAFSLHSLPQATGFYERLGMTHCPEEDKEGLKFFEISASKARLLMEDYI